MLQRTPGTAYVSTHDRGPAPLNTALKRMWFFGPKAHLIRALDELAFYNDKGVVYAQHDDTSAAQARAARLRKIHALVARVGESNLPAALLHALRSGEVDRDATDRYVELAKN